jgi:DNA helicase-2/ATP-dependent DNA helicase PcrA
VTSTLFAATDRVLDGLSDAQLEAVTHGDGPLLIIAGAGTGKTTVLTRRIAHLITSKQARPEQILALTFTEKAAREMAERVDQLIPYGYAESRISTFHAFGDAVLREFGLEVGLNPQARVLSRPEQVIFLRERLFELPLERFRPLGDPTRHLSALLGLVSRAKDEDVTPERYLAWAEELALLAQGEEGEDEARRQLELARFYGAYQRLLAEAGAVDFGDQIFRALELLRARPAVLGKLRARYRWILLDEFQDTNHAQLALVRLLAGEDAPNITVVGDDDQAIYRWRGAAASNLLAFRALYPGCREVVLTRNHRSVQAILDASARLISYNNPYRLEVVAGIDKRLRAVREPQAGPAVRHLHYETLSAEADGVAQAVADRLSGGCRPGDVALLVRSNDDADPFLRALNVKGIPHRFSGNRGLYAREEVRLLVSFLRVLASPDDSVSLFHLAGSELYGVPELELLRMNRFARRRTRPLLEVFRGLPGEEDLVGVGGKARDAVARLLADVDRAAADVPSKRTGEVLYRYLQDSGLLGRLAAEATLENEARVKNIARFFETVKAYGDVARHDRVPSFVEHLELLRDAGDDPAVAEPDLDDAAVPVLTVHKAKGLEFPVVFLVGCVDGKFPVHRRGESLEVPPALLPDEAVPGDVHLQEERRLFYVAMTRARDELVLTSAADYGTARARKLSRFVVEALDLPSPAPVTRRGRAVEALLRHAPEPMPADTPPAPVRPHDLMHLSFRQIDDYRTCPLKYKFVHHLRVPLLVHHRIVYGAAVHTAIQEHYKARVAGRAFGVEDLVRSFREAWVSEGFLSREHEEQRLRAGEQTLRRFHAADAEHPLHPTAVEEEFAFEVGRTRVIGRYDLVVEEEGRVSILDFKTGEVADRREAQRRAAESLQLDIYALAHLRTRGRLPDRLELRFLESGLVGGRRPELAETQATEEVVREVADAVRRRDFSARPSFRACSPCPFRDICPHTASSGDD